MASLAAIGYGPSGLRIQVEGASPWGKGTVKTHVTRILAKLGLCDRVQAAVLAYETGLIRPGTSDSASSHRSS